MTDDEHAPAPLRTCSGTGCTQQVFFARIRRKDGTPGRPQPFDWPPATGGAYAQVGEHAGAPLLAKTDPPGESTLPDGIWALGPVGYVPHHATCPAVAEFRGG